MSPYIIPGIKRDGLKQTSKFIKEVLCRYFDVNPELIVSTRKREIVICRQYLMYFLKQRTDYSLKTIGKQIHTSVEYDHTTVIHSINRINNFISINDEVTINNINAIKKLLNETNTH